MDFFEKLMKKFGYVKEKKTESEKTDSSKEKPRVDLGVCVPLHAKKAKDSKKIKFVVPEDDESPFDKLRKEYEKDKADFNKEVKEITESTPKEPFDYEPELGIESIEAKKPVLAAAPKTSKSPFGKILFSGESENEEESEDELDTAAKKMDEGYVPRFSSTARQKLGFENKPATVAPMNTGYAQFEVTGVYAGAETMISGIVRYGKLTKRMTAQVGKNTIRVSDLKQSFASVDSISEGQNGTIFTHGGAGLIRNGDIIEFA